MADGIQLIIDLVPLGSVHRGSRLARVDAALAANDAAVTSQVNGSDATLSSDCANLPFSGSSATRCRSISWLVVAVRVTTSSALASTVDPLGERLPVSK